MADKPKPPSGGLMDEFGWFVWGLVGIAAIWFFTGGPQRQSAHEGAYIKPLEPVNTGEVYGNYYEGTAGKPKQTINLPEAPADILKNAESGIKSFIEQVQEAERIHTSSLLARRISFDGVAGAKNTSVNEEYLRIVASEYAKGTIMISDLLLRGIALNSYVLIPRASELPLAGVTTSKKIVSLPPGGRALISTGRSPIGTSFRVNMCTGYLDQFQKYTPDLRKDCPDPAADLKTAGLSSDSSCVDFVESLPRCRIYQGKFPSNLSTSCKAFVTEKLNYNSCALSHKDDDDFYSNEWRLFLEETKELWANKNEVIRLIDSKSDTIDAITY